MNKTLVQERVGNFHSIEVLMGSDNGSNSSNLISEGNSKDKLIQVCVQVVCTDHTRKKYF